jgi:hypothetical protein
MGFESYEQLMRADILIVAGAYQRATGQTMTMISRLSHGDPPVLDRLAAGKGSITLRKRDDMMRWFAANWPAKTPMPKICRLVPPRNRGPTR